MNPRHLIIRWLTPLVWKLSPARKLQALQRFSAVEKDSGHQLQYCVSLVSDSRLKCYLFQHVLEEFFHSELFEEQCRRISDRHLYLEVPPRIDLLPPQAGPGEVLDFFAYVHVGEQAVNRDFVVYSHAPLEPELRAVFRRAGMDEGHHEEDTLQILEGLAGGTGWSFRSRLTVARARRAWSLFADAMKSIGVVPMTAAIGLIYFVLGPVALGSARERLRLPEEEQLRIFRDQVAMAEKSLA